MGEIDLEPPDEDYYKYVAHDTGKLYVRIYFTHALGDLDLEVLDREQGRRHLNAFLGSNASRTASPINTKRLSMMARVRNPVMPSQGA